MMIHNPPPRWLRVLVRVDFLCAVALTVLAPLALLGWALRESQHAHLRVLLRYWRASSLLMVSVYLLIAERRVAFVTGIAARLLIAWTLWRAPPAEDDGSGWYARWRRVTTTYCLAGAALNLPTLRGLRGTPLPLLCRAYVEPAQEFGALLHPRVPRATLGRAGMRGLWAFGGGAVALWLFDKGHR